MNTNIKLGLVRFCVFVLLLLSIAVVVDFGQVYFGVKESNFITGFQVREVIENEDTLPLFSERDALDMRIYDEYISESCRNYYTDSNECFFALKTIMSITSKGNPGYEYDDNIGLIPLPSNIVYRAEYESIFRNTGAEGNLVRNPSPEDLKNPDLNIPAAVKYFMDIYSQFNDDMQFAVIGYFGTRRLATALNTELLTLNPDDFSQGEITAEIIYENLENAYLKAELDEADISFEYVKYSFHSFLRAYELWEGSPVKASMADEVLYEFGMYSIRPSFSTQAKYNVRDYDKIEQTLKSYIEYSRDSSLDSDFDNFEKHLFDYLKDNPDAKLSNGAIEYDGFVWHDGDCDDKLEAAYTFLEVIDNCLNASVTCSCDLSSLNFDDNLKIKVKKEADNRFLFQIWSSQNPDKLVYSFSKIIDRPVSIRFGDDINEEGEDYEHELEFTSAKNNDLKINNKKYSFIDFELGSKKTIVIPDSSFDPPLLPTCEQVTKYQRFCVENRQSLLFKQTYEGLKYEPVRYRFSVKFALPDEPEIETILDQESLDSLPPGVAEQILSQN